MMHHRTNNELNNYFKYKRIRIQHKRKILKQNITEGKIRVSMGSE